MNKKTTTLLVCFVTVLAILTTAFPVFATSTNSIGKISVNLTQNPKTASVTPYGNSTPSSVVTRKPVPRFNFSGYEIGKKITAVSASLASNSDGVIDIPYYGEDYAIYPQDPTTGDEALRSVIIDDDAVFEAGKTYYLTVAIRPKSGYSLEGITKDDVLLNGTQKPIGFIQTATSTNLWPVFKLSSSHSHVAGNKWKSNANNHWHVCTVSGCGVVIKSSKAAHTFEWKTDKQATATENGSKHEECTVCGYKKAAVKIQATGTAVKPTSTSNEYAKSPKTGYNGITEFCVALLFLGCAGVVGTTVVYRKKRSVK